MLAAFHGEGLVAPWSLSERRPWGPVTKRLVGWGSAPSGGGDQRPVWAGAWGGGASENHRPEESGRRRRGERTGPTVDFLSFQGV